MLLQDDLPTVTWRIPTSGALVADVDSLASTPDEQRVVFAAWAGRLGAVVSERTSSDGVVHLHGTFKLHGGVGGAIRADIHPPLEEGGVL
ncbi:hypothetical protein [Streptomyces sp. NPDC058268]|uniref:hypothetical protein n=1 Tax=Streptomyces sp. NPDC058268 TaxID=3346413 RepID=UPI0036E88362